MYASKILKLNYSFQRLLGDDLKWKGSLPRLTLLHTMFTKYTSANIINAVDGTCKKEFHLF